MIQRQVFSLSLPLFIGLFFVSCASLPEFQKTNADSGLPGYWVVPLVKDSSVATVYTRLPKSISDLYRYHRRYSIVAATNYCLESKFKYSDVLSSTFESATDSVETRKAMVFCKHDELGHVLNIDFEEKPTDSGYVLVVNKINAVSEIPAKESLFKVGDILRTAGNEPIKDISKLQYLVSDAGKRGLKSIAVEVLRDNKQVKFQERIVSTSYYTKDNQKVSRIRSF